MAVCQPTSQENGKYSINITNSSIQNLVIGDGNTVNNYCRRLEYPEQSTASRSGRIAFRRTAITDGGEWRGRKRKQTKIRFPQRKHRADRKFSSKNASSDSDEDTLRYNGPETFPIVSAELLKESMNRFQSILNKLHPLRDSGNFKDFSIVAGSILMARKGDLELEILILIEKSVVVSYQNDLEKAELMVLEALDTLRKAKVGTKDFLVTMAHVHLTGFYRRQNKHAKATDSVTIAEQNSQNVDSRYVKALIFYEKASNLTKYISSIPLDRSAREQLVKRSKKYMKKCIDLCIELDDARVYIKKHHFGLLKLALLDLNCRTRAARSQLPSPECIEDADTCLKAVEKKYKNEMSEGQKIQFFVAKSDLNYRRKKFEAAQRDASQALSLAETHGFSLEINAIKDRQEDIISKLITSKKTPKKTRKKTMAFGTFHSKASMESLSSSTAPSQKNSPSSSGCEME